jgi:short-subunit dehydrogenase
MQELRGRTALLTGAAGGLGRHIARSLAKEGIRLVLSGRNEAALAQVRTELVGAGADAEVVTGDLTDARAIDDLVDQTESRVGPIDILVNNAGVEFAARFTGSSREELGQVVAVNLIAPMFLAHRLLPGMLERRQGHVVNIASLAGKAGPPFAAPYAATKAGLIGLTQSLRQELVGSNVGCSVICPGFVAQDGMFARLEVKPPMAVGSSRPENVGKAVVRAIRKDLPEVIVNPRPVRPMLELAIVAPRQAERLLRASGAADTFRRMAEASERS